MEGKQHEKRESCWQDIRQKGNFQLRFYIKILHRRQHLLGLSNCATRVQTLGAGPCAVKNGVATVDAHAVVESGLALGGALITRIGQPAVGLEQDGGAQILLAVPPI